jgi:hypothetical protein
MTKDQKNIASALLSIFIIFLVVQMTWSWLEYSQWYHPKETKEFFLISTIKWLSRN